MQDPDHQKAKCARCKALPGEPCIDRFGDVADKVHYGRPRWSTAAGRKFAKLRGAGRELDFELIEFKIINVLDSDYREVGGQGIEIPEYLVPPVRRETRPCGYWTGGEFCGSIQDVRPYAVGSRCPSHRPAVLAGRVIPGVT